MNNTDLGNDWAELTKPQKPDIYPSLRDHENAERLLGDKGIRVCTAFKDLAAEQYTKPANPKQAFGDKKPPLHLIHLIAQLHESAALHAGKRKYGENNYIATPVELMTYVGAIMRHCLQYASGERVDQKELVHHLGAIKACCTILLTAEACGVLLDNRPEVLDHPKCAERGAVSYQAATATTFAEVESIIEHLNKLYPA